MGIRHWLRKRLAEQHDEGEEDSAPSGSIISAIFGRQPPTLHALGEFDQSTYPGELQDLLRRREDVAEELREMDLTTRQARIDAIPRLHQMLRTYPHPLAYEVLIHAYVDAGRWDEARGAAFAARERRTQVSRSPYSEIRAEIDRLKEWTPEEVELVRQEREGSPAYVPPAAPSKPSRPAEPELVEVARPAAAPEPVRAPEPAEPVRAPEPVAVAEPVASTERTETVDSMMEPVDSAELRASADMADRADSVDSDGMTEPMDAAETGDPADSDELEDAGPAGGVAAAGSGGGGGGSRPGGKKGRSRGKRRRK